MKTTITVEDGDVRITFSPESEIERLAICELGDNVSVSRSHQNLVLRRRGEHVRGVIEGGRLGVVADVMMDAEDEAFEAEETA
jgi:hypothetical protein